MEKTHRQTKATPIPSPSKGTIHESKDVKYQPPIRDQPSVSSLAWYFLLWQMLKSLATKVHSPVQQVPKDPIMLSQVSPSAKHYMKNIDQHDSSGVPNGLALG
ncbi:hypothetical protein ACMFMF_002583 [Clarireedia jacksonii]